MSKPLKPVAERFGIPPAERSPANRTNATGSCPDILLVNDATRLKLEGTPGLREGQVFLAIGTLVTKEQFASVDVPEGASVAGYEAVIALPPEVVLAAARQLMAQEFALEAERI
jgi:hypothetical protein